MKEIILTRGYKTMVDDEDFERMSKYPWYAHTIKGVTYAVRGEKIGGKRFTFRMHREITNCPKDLVVDHINKDTLNNQKSNLRVCTQAQNLVNRQFKSNKGGYRGVNPTPSGKWQARIKKDGKEIYLGLFEDKLEAAKAYNTAAIKYHGEFAVINKLMGM